MDEQEYYRVTAFVRLRIARFARQYFTGLGSWRDEDADAFAERIVPIVLAGQRQIATLTDLYLAGQIAEMFGSGPEPGRLDLDEVTGAPTRNGTDPNVVYHRPFVEIYTALSEGLPLAAAVERGATRLDSLTNTDMQLARTHTARATFAKSEVEYYRRTLTSAKSCALCIVASTQRYSRRDLLPIHPGCHCGVDSVKGRVPHVLDKAQLEEIHAQVEAFAGRHARDAREIDYREIIVTQEHGEYGPTLAYRGQQFTGPDDLS